MQQFTIKDVENLLGIKAHTLRIWEQRYAFFAPKRKDSQHRYYDNDDLKLLLQVAFLYHQGMKISHIAAMDTNALQSAVAAVTPNAGNYQHFVIQLVSKALAFDEAAFKDIIEQLVVEIGFEHTIMNVCFPFLQRVGLLWITNHLVPAQEHFCSYLILNKIISETQRLPLPVSPVELLLFAPKGEFHEVPLLYLHYLLRKQGWSVLFLGKNVDVSVLQTFKEQPSIRFLWVHLLTNFLQLDAEVYLEQLIRTFPGKTILASGRAFMSVQRNFVNVELLLSDDAIQKRIANHKRELSTP